MEWWERGRLRRLPTRSKDLIYSSVNPWILRIVWNNSIPEVLET